MKIDMVELRSALIRLLTASSPLNGKVTTEGG